MRIHVEYDEPVLKNDMEHELEYAQQGQREFLEMYYRLSHQGAPPELVEQVAQVVNLYKQVEEKVTAILPCFPERS